MIPLVDATDHCSVIYV